MITRQQWYDTRFIKLEIIKSLIHRETVFLPFYQDEIDGKIKAKPPVRNLNASYDKMLDRHFQEFDFFNQKMNLYASLVTWKDFPTFNYNWRIRSQEQDIWNKKFDDYIIALDWFIETDSDTLYPAIEDGKRIKKMLDEYKIKYCVSYSGSKGLHFIIPYEDISFLPVKIFDRDMESEISNFKKYLPRFPVKISDLNKIADLVLLLKVMSIRLKRIYALDTLDDSVSDIRRIRKTPYSWDVKSDKICLPLTDEQLDNFDKNKMSADEVIKIRLFKRGQLWRNEYVDIKVRQQGILELLRELEIIV